MEKEEANRLAADLLKMMRSGQDQRAQIDFICNSLRMKKRDATELQRLFYSGVHAGCDSIIKGKNEWPQSSHHPLHIAAFYLGRVDFENKLEEQRRKHRPKPKGSAVVLGLILSIMVALIILLVAL